MPQGLRSPSQNSRGVFCLSRQTATNRNQHPLRQSTSVPKSKCYEKPTIQSSRTTSSPTTNRRKPVQRKQVFINEKKIRNLIVTSLAYRYALERLCENTPISNTSQEIQLQRNDGKSSGPMPPMRPLCKKTITLSWDCDETRGLMWSAAIFLVLVAVYSGL